MGWSALGPLGPHGPGFTQVLLAGQETLSWVFLTLQAWDTFFENSLYV